MEKKSLVGLLAVVVLLAGAAWLWMRYEHSKKGEVNARPVQCASCGAEYTPKTPSPDEPCPYCGSTAHVIRMWYRCRDCGHEWVGYETNPEDKTFRRPDGEWVSATEFDRTMICPECDSQRASSIRRPSTPSE